MFICEDCKATFDIPNKGYGIEKDSCPNCGSWGIREAKTCRICGEPSINEICEGCKEEFKLAVEWFIDMFEKTLGLPRDEIVDMIEDNLTYTAKAERIG